MNYKILSVVSVSLTMLFTPEVASAVDKDGCYKPSSSCISAQSSWEGNKLMVRYYNSCNKRIYLRFCNELTRARSPDCGATGIKPSESKSWWTTKQNATGKYSYHYTGSTIGSKDWVCSGKVRGWKDHPF